jgi:hypothetical protein
MTSKTYPLPDPAAVAAKVAAVGGPRVDPTQPTGTASADGVTLTWVTADGQITLTIESKPFFISDGTIWAHADPLFAT